MVDCKRNMSEYTQRIMEEVLKAEDWTGRFTRVTENKQNGAVDENVIRQLLREVKEHRILAEKREIQQAEVQLSLLARAALKSDRFAVVCEAVLLVPAAV